MFCLSYLRERLLPSAAFCATICFLTGLLLFLSTTLIAQAAPSLSPRQPAAPKLALIPMPREIREVKDVSLAKGAGIMAAGKDAEDKFAADDLASSLKERGIDARIGKTGKIKIVLLRQQTKKGGDNSCKRPHQF
jgi:hexosaminidase